MHYTDKWFIDGLIMGMEDMGCEFIKQKENCFYFEIPKEFKNGYIQRAKPVFVDIGARLFTKINENLILNKGRV